MRTVCCPFCRVELTPELLLADQEERDALDFLIESSLPSGAQVMRYMVLFTPPKSKLSSARKVKIFKELRADLERRAITVAGQDVPAPLDHWNAAFEQMHQQHLTGSFKALPLTGHGYLYRILAGLGEKLLAARERQVEEDRRQHPRQHEARSAGPVNVVEALAAPHVISPARVLGQELRDRIKRGEA